jgi:hypothetical protein
MQRLSVTLPRYGLSFFVNEKEELESRDFKDMVYDEDQSVGALFGLENLLVLRPKTQIAGALVPDALIPRRVLIPNGFPVKRGKHRIEIDIVEKSLRVARCNEEPLYHTYDVDTDLGCLIGNGTLTSTRLLAYVHAVTSCCWSDLLTGKTGAQAALSLLQSAGCRSIMKHKALDESDSKYWVETKYPAINTAYEEIQSRYYWNDGHGTIKESEKRAAPRAAYPFPFNAARLATGPQEIYQCLPRRITLDQLLCDRPAPELPARNALPRERHNTSSHDIPLLDQLFSSLHLDSSFQREYLARLDTSAQCVRLESEMTHGMAGENHIHALKEHFVRCRVDYLDSLDILKKGLGPTTDLHEQILDQFGWWPPITADVLLRYLASTSTVDIPSRWKKCLISLALLFLELQRA